jgi:hypothetical protein
MAKADRKWQLRRLGLVCEPALAEEPSDEAGLALDAGEVVACVTCQ